MQGDEPMMTKPPSRWEQWGLVGAFLVVCLMTVAGMVVVLGREPTPITYTILPPPPTATPEPTATPAPLMVYVTGAVGVPNQLVTVPPDGRVGDAIRLAGGLRADADLERVNLAAFVTDGQQVHVPVLGEVSAPVAPVGEVAGAAGVLDINRATAEELTALPGIGPALAERIIAYREANGRIGSLEDLDNVSGIGPSILGQIEGMVTFGTP
jgi:competence protein ComEA